MFSLLKDLTNSKELEINFLISSLGDLAHALRFLASVVSQSFLAFGDILELHKKFIELSGGINRILELEEFLDAAQSGNYIPSCFFLTIYTL